MYCDMILRKRHIAGTHYDAEVNADYLQGGAIANTRITNRERFGMLELGPWSQGYIGGYSLGHET